MKAEKILIVWLPELMNGQAANKLFVIEEPPEKNKFDFVSDRSEQLLQTISSRLQQIKVPLKTTLLVRIYNLILMWKKMMLICFQKVLEATYIRLYTNTLTMKKVKNF